MLSARVLAYKWLWAFHFKEEEVKNFAEREFGFLFKKLKPVCHLGSASYGGASPTW